MITEIGNDNILNTMILKKTSHEINVVYSITIFFNSKFASRRNTS